MKAEHFLDSVGMIDDDLILTAEQNAQFRRIPRLHPHRWLHIAALAACLALVLLTGAAFASGLLHPFTAYLRSERAEDADIAASYSVSVANEDLELRLECAVADTYTVSMLVSLIGRSDSYKKRLSTARLSEAEAFQYYAVSKAGEKQLFVSTVSGTFTESSLLEGKKAKTLYPDADMTFLISCILPDSVCMQDMKTVCVSFEDLTLSFDAAAHLVPEYELAAEASSADAVLTDFYISSSGFRYRIPAELDGTAIGSIMLIREDGTLRSCETDDTFGYHGSSTTDACFQCVSHSISHYGFWTGGSMVSLGLIDLQNYVGAQVAGVNYYFISDPS